jgi:hypothetical protein
VPEEIILAVLADFKKHKPAEVIRKILERLTAIGQEEILLRKYVRQLSMLARLRNLTQETHKQVQDMGLLYDITKDYLYQEGVVKGKHEGKHEVVVTMLKDGTLPLEKIAALTGVALNEVNQIAQELKK